MTEYHEPGTPCPKTPRTSTGPSRASREELEAVDWYHQRVAVADSDELRAILEHNRDEEIEHAAMLLEWLRRRMDGWNDELETYLFTSDPITEVEDKEHSH